MSGMKFPSRSWSQTVWQRPVLVITAGGLLAFALWTLPNWTEFWSNVFQFPTLWQIPTNRRIILYLTLRVLSPVLIMGMLWIVLQIASLVRSSLDEEATGAADHQQARPRGYESEMRHSTSPSMRAQTSERHDVSSSPPLTMRPAPVSWRHDPVTPIPPTSELSEVIEQTTFTGMQDGTPIPPIDELPETFSQQEDGPKNSAIYAPDEQQIALADLKDEDSDASTSLISPLITSTTPDVVSETSEEMTSPNPLISIRLLKDVSIVINVPGGDQIAVPVALNSKRVQLLAYIAWRRGEPIHREKILEQVFGWGLSDEEATEDKLSERFESHKKLLRRKIREAVVEQVNKPAGRQVIDPNLDLFAGGSSFWSLSGICRVDDLETVEACHQVISVARKEGKLVDEVPEEVYSACEQLIANYSGDFLDTLLKNIPTSFVRGREKVPGYANR